MDQGIDPIGPILIPILIPMNGVRMKAPLTGGTVVRKARQDGIGPGSESGSILGCKLEG